MVREEVEQILEGWRDRVHPVYEEEREKIEHAAAHFVEERRTPAGMRAALDRAVARMADTESTYLEVADRYEVGVAEVIDWSRRLQRIGGYTLDLPEVQDFDEEAATEQLRSLLAVRPYTDKELRQEVYTPEDIDAYLSGHGVVERLETELPAGDVLTVWYNDGDDMTAQAKLRYEQARASLQEEKSDFTTFLHDFGGELKETGAITDVESWVQQRGAVEDKLQTFKEEAAPHFGVFEQGFPAVQDYLVSYDESNTYFTAMDVHEYLAQRNVSTADSPTNIGRTLKILSERIETLEEFGGSPRKYDAHSTTEEDVYVVDAALTRIGEFTRRYR